MRYFALVLAALLVLAAPSDGATTMDFDGNHYVLSDEVVSDPLIDWAVGQAEQHWGVPVCRTPWKVLVRRRTAVTIQSNAIAFGEMGSCGHWIQPWMLVTSDSIRMCSIITHELGHNLGKDHNDPDPVMAPELEQAPPECKVPAVLPRRTLLTGKNIGWCKRHRDLCMGRYYRLYAKTYQLVDAWTNEEVRIIMSLTSAPSASRAGVARRRAHALGCAGDVQVCAHVCAGATRACP